jgi:RND family efflux transporter MFP subunit
VLQEVQKGKAVQGLPEKAVIPAASVRRVMAAASLFLGALTFPSLVPAREEETASTVTLAEVTLEPMREHVRLSGTSIPWRRVLLSPRVEGLVTAVLVDQGSWVKPADPILELDARLAEIAIDSASAQVRESEARHQDAIRIRDELMKLKKGRHASETSIESAIAEVEVAAAALSRQRADLARAQELRERHSVAAPFAGMVVGKQVEVGQWVQRDDAVVELVAMDTLRVRAPLPQRYFPRVADGARAWVLFDALPGKEIEGKVFARVALGNEASRSFPLLIDIPNPDHSLAPGMSARIRVELEDGDADALTVPRDSVVAKSDGSRQVWRVREVGGVLSAFPVSVEIGRAQGDRLELLGVELAAGDRIVLLGNESLRPGQPVRPRVETPAVASE